MHPWIDDYSLAASPLSPCSVPSRFVLAQPCPGWQDDAESPNDVLGIQVAHFTDSRQSTGCTVVMTEDEAVGDVDVHGSAPGTHETDLLQPTNFVEKVHAMMPSGGSGFGLDAATSAMRCLEERKIGHDVGVTHLLIVPAANIFDLDVGDSRIRPEAQAATAPARPRSQTDGNVGAGAGATGGKLFGRPARHEKRSRYVVDQSRLPCLTVGALMMVS